MSLQSVRGTKDILPPMVRDFERLETAARRLADLWGFIEIRTPAFEEVALFARSVGETTDIVEKEMFTFTDRGGRCLALRPEGTAGVVRAYLEHHLGRESKKTQIFYIADMFRAERPQAGRWREFEQIGFEIIGDPSAVAEIELLTLAWALLKDFGIDNLSLQINSLGCPQCREPYKKKLGAWLTTQQDMLCEDCRRRREKNPLRCLDCKNCAAKLGSDAPNFDKCGDCKAHKINLVELLDAQGFIFTQNPKIVRGLDYYTKTVFEIFCPDLGAEVALLGGGRYDGLVELLGGPATPAAGFALGVDRVILAKNATETPGPPSPALKKTALVLASTQPEAAQHALRLAAALRQAQTKTFLCLWQDSVKSQMRQAVKAGAAFCVLVGDDELQQKNYTLKDLRDGKQRQLTLEAALKELRDA